MGTSSSHPNRFLQHEERTQLLSYQQHQQLNSLSSFHGLEYKNMLHYQPHEEGHGTSLTPALLADLVQSTNYSAGEIKQLHLQFANDILCTPADSGSFSDGNRTKLSTSASYISPHLNNHNHNNLKRGLHFPTFRGFFEASLNIQPSSSTTAGLSDSDESDEDQYGQKPKKHQKPSLEAVAAMIFRGFDADQDGIITFPEFVLGLHSMTRGNECQRLAFAFRMYDNTGSGRLSRVHVESLLHSLQHFNLLSPTTKPSSDAIPSLLSPADIVASAFDIRHSNSNPSAQHNDGVDYKGVHRSEGHLSLEPLCLYHSEHPSCSLLDTIDFEHFRRWARSCPEVVRALSL